MDGASQLVSATITTPNLSVGDQETVNGVLLQVRAVIDGAAALYMTQEVASAGVISAIGANLMNVLDQPGISEGNADNGTALRTAFAKADTDGLVIVIPHGTNLKYSGELIVEGGVQIEMQGSARLEHLSGSRAMLFRGTKKGLVQRFHVHKTFADAWYHPTQGNPETDVGVEIKDSSESTFHGQVTGGFGIGLWLHGAGPTEVLAGVAYNEFHYSGVDNITNLKISRDDAEGVMGFVNQNLFYGRCTHTGSSGLNGTPTAQRINIDLEGNNNTFIGFSLEGETNTERSVVIHSVDNYFINCRWEFAAPIEFTNVRANSNPSNNVIDGGNGFFGPELEADIGGAFEVSIINTGTSDRRNSFRSPYGQTFWSVSGPYGDNYAMRLMATGATDSHSALEILRDAENELEGTLTGTLDHDGSRTELGTNGTTMYRLTKPSAAGAAAWELA